MNSPTVHNGLIFDEFTPTEKRIMVVLSDGHRHRFDEMYGCIDDEQANHLNTLTRHVSAMRKKLRRRGLDILLEKNGRMHYRVVRLLNTQE